MIEVDTTLTPRELLESARGVEDSLGRVRAERWGPRTIDVDILVYDERTVDEPDLVIPHPRMHERGFVLVPLGELDADAMLPGGRRLSTHRLSPDAVFGVRPFAPPLPDRAGMTETVCFRCDWQGRARARACPSCGAPLYRPDREDVARAPDAFDLDEARVGEVASRRPAPRGRSMAIAVALAIATVVSIQLFAASARDGAHARLARTSFGPVRSCIAVDDGRGGSTLWMVDLLVGIGTSRPVDPDRDVGARRPVRRRSGMGRRRTTDASIGRSPPSFCGTSRRRRRRPARAAATSSRGDRVAGAWSSPATDGSNARGARRSASAW